MSGEIGGMLNGIELAKSIFVTFNLQKYFETVARSKKILCAFKKCLAYLQSRAVEKLLFYFIFDAIAPPSTYSKGPVSEWVSDY